MHQPIDPIMQYIIYVIVNAISICHFIMCYYKFLHISSQNLHHFVILLHFVLISTQYDNAVTNYTIGCRGAVDNNG